ncbi:molybdate ABC transporter substrate-binding protein [Mangrovitalea sediminis]|uniref:molybdate ABC transporter substrate-binding protein n=1 Tax=Mangrovitalea sediminis TaxID=1982043 RepID=UPI0018E929C0|nr:molybdate ABC transporter substrate-binding protein [Mangrovitalea sediminis]
MSRLVLLLCLCLASVSAWSETARVAVAANFAGVAKQLAARYEKVSGNRIELVRGSTGKLYAQIEHGAPYDVFLAADIHRPKLLEADGHGKAGSRFTYAIGQLALWQPGGMHAHDTLLQPGQWQLLAIANPKLAPYGLAAQQTLEKMHLWQSVKDRLVLGENISQAYQFVASGAASLGFIALSHARANHLPDSSLWIVPGSMHAPIEQQAVRLTDNTAGRDFLTFLQSAKARPIIEAAGYKLPD